MPVRRDGSTVATSSPFADRLHSVIERWAARLPQDLREQFRNELNPLADEYERTLDTIESIWRRREQEYALDQSTGLARQPHLLQHLAALLCMRPTDAFRAIGVVFIDLDNMKKINDTCGHPAGDRAIAAAARIIREAVRVSRHIDIVDHPRKSDSEYAISRLGGDEFVVVLELRDVSEIDVVALRLKRNIDDVERQQAHGYQAPARMAASVGGVAYKLPDTPVASSPHEIAKGLVSLADQLMYDSKHDSLVHLAVARYIDRLAIEQRHVQTP